MRLVFGQDRAVGKWIADRVPEIGNASSFGHYTAIGVTNEDGEAVCGVAYHNYHPRYKSINVTIASDDPRWARKGVIRALFAYPFLQLDCNRIQTFIPAKNERSRKLCEGLGFTLEGIGREGFLTDDLVAFGLLKRDCKWIRTK